MNRILGIDYGERRIGLAISDPLQIIATPLKVIDRKITPEYISVIQKIIIERNVKKIVVGLPLTMKGSISKQTELTLLFIDSLKKSFEVPVCTIDERLSSKEAKRILISKGIKTGHNKSSVDLIAAGIILQEYLDSK